MDFVDFNYACDNVALQQPTTKRSIVNRVTTVLPTATEICDFIEQNNFSVIPKFISRNYDTGVIGYIMAIFYNRRFEISKSLNTALGTLKGTDGLFKLTKCNQQLIVSPVSFNGIHFHTEVNENILNYSEINTIVSWFIQKMDTDFEKLTEAEMANIESRGGILFNNGKVIVQSSDITCTGILDYYKQNNLWYFITSEQIIRILFKYKNELIEYNYYEGDYLMQKYCFLVKYIAEALINQHLK